MNKHMVWFMNNGTKQTYRIIVDAVDNETLYNKIYAFAGTKDLRKVTIEKFNPALHGPEEIYKAL